ncbi:Prephenate and/or arogenate dehydrogenase (unknown specificity) [hydrothermal vent metagenome]|uniref:Prephenate/arogenate dehydrogenase domain-containing protein n=1 Tax=hydrothermal vent metagenome TaxID=652676 RepID=A0A1W1CYI6_9ZZZZ
MYKQKIGFIGLGLMGGSLSLTLRKISPDSMFIGLDHNTLHCEQALALNLVDKITTSLDIIKTCDIIIISIPVNSIIKVAQNLAPLPKHCTVIDLGSTKAKISASIPLEIRENFITAHPMTGTEKFGPSAAIPNLYQDKVVVLCDLEKSGVFQRKIANALFENIGMKIVTMNAKEHDRHAGFISHTPHALSYALANSVLKQEDSSCIVTLAGGGFRDMSRIAKSSPNMWEDIFKQNKDNVLESIEAFEEELHKCKNMIKEENWEALNEWMGEANKLHDIL